MKSAKKGTADACLHLPEHAYTLHILVDSAPGAMPGFIVFVYLQRHLHLGEVPDM